MLEYISLLIPTPDLPGPQTNETHTEQVTRLQSHLLIFFSLTRWGAQENPQGTSPGMPEGMSKVGRPRNFQLQGLSVFFCNSPRWQLGTVSKPCPFWCSAGRPVHWTVTVRSLHQISSSVLTCIAQGVLCHDMQQGQGPGHTCQLYSSGPSIVETPKGTAWGRAAWEDQTCVSQQGHCPDSVWHSRKEAPDTIWGFKQHDVSQWEHAVFW